MKSLFASLFAAAWLLAGCASVHENVSSLGAVGAGEVLVVGRIEIVPPLRAGEQKFRLGFDPTNSQRHYEGRAVMFVSDEAKFSEDTGVVLNPPLQETFFVTAPRNKPYMVSGWVAIKAAVQMTSRRHAHMEYDKLVLPAFRIDAPAGERAVYIGTLRLHRDEFNEVTKAEVLDHYAAAALEFHKRFPGNLPPRKALLRVAR